MSRAFSPPDTLSRDQRQALYDVRREIWINAAKGLVSGTLGGYVCHFVAKVGSRRKWWKLTTNRNTAMLSVLLGGAFGSFLMAVTTGKNQVHKLHPVFVAGARDSSIDETLEEARARARALHSLETKRNLTQAELDVLDHEKRGLNRIYRRATQKQFLNQSHGLSDSHGGHWVDEKEFMNPEPQTDDATTTSDDDKENAPAAS